VGISNQRAGTLRLEGVLVDETQPETVSQYAGYGLASYGRGSVSAHGSRITGSGTLGLQAFSSFSVAPPPGASPSLEPESWEGPGDVTLYGAVVDNTQTVLEGQFGLGILADSAIRLVIGHSRVINNRGFNLWVFASDVTEGQGEFERQLLGSVFGAARIASTRFGGEVTTQHGGGVASTDHSEATLISGCVMAGNESSGVFLSGSPHTKLTRTLLTGSYYGLVHQEGPKPDLEHVLIIENTTNIASDQGLPVPEPPAMVGIVPRNME